MYAEFVVAAALVSPFVFVLAWAAQVGWRQKRALGRWVHDRTEDSDHVGQGVIR